MRLRIMLVVLKNGEADPQQENVNLGKGKL